MDVDSRCETTAWEGGSAVGDDGTAFVVVAVAIMQLLQTINFVTLQARLEDEDHQDFQFVASKFQY
jgi:hypothetical protein